MNQYNFRQLVSGRSTGFKAHILRSFLRVISQVYLIIAALRNFLYSRKWLEIHTSGVPVISVGNITTGGTGKTPLVIWLCKFLQQKEFQCAILTRGYKTYTQTIETRDGRCKTKIDEPAILSESCPQAKIIVNPNRVKAAAEAVNKFGAKVLIMDDGFQHRRLHRDLDIVTIDGTCPFGYWKLLPAGLLREPVASLKRADAVVVTRCDQIPESELNRIEKKLQLIKPDMIIAKSIHNPICAKNITDEITIEQLKNRKIFAFCGIGNPSAFLNTIKSIDVNPVGSQIYDDHYHYTNDCLADICEQACHLDADLILTTYKDWTKISLLTPAKKDIPFAYLEIEIKFLVGEDKLKELILDILAGKIHY